MSTRVVAPPRLTPAEDTALELRCTTSTPKWLKRLIFGDLSEGTTVAHRLGMALNSKALMDAAQHALSRGNLQSAETNLRLALSFAPNDRSITEALERIVAQRRVQERPAHG